MLKRGKKLSGKTEFNNSYIKFEHKIAISSAEAPILIIFFKTIIRSCCISTDTSFKSI